MNKMTLVGTASATLGDSEARRLFFGHQEFFIRVLGKLRIRYMRTGTFCPKTKPDESMIVERM